MLALMFNIARDSGNAHVCKVLCLCVKLNVLRCKAKNIYFGIEIGNCDMLTVNIFILKNNFLIHVQLYTVRFKSLGFN